MRMQFSAKLHAHAIVHAIFGAYNSFMMGVYQLVWTSVMISRELMNKFSLWNPFFEERKLGSFFLCIFWEILCIYISGLQLQNIHPKTLKKIRESYNTYSHGILTWEKWFSKISEKWIRLFFMLRVLRIFVWFRTSCVMLIH